MGRRERARAEHAAGLLALHLRSAPGRSAPREYPVSTPEYPILSGTRDDRRRWRAIGSTVSAQPKRSAGERVREGSAAQRV
jgi:hypothetical protein